MTRQQRKEYNASMKLTHAEVAAAVGISQRKLAQAFFIPIRTWQSWSSCQRAAPAYEWLAILYVLGLYRHPAARPASDLTTEDKGIAISRTSAEISAMVGEPRYKLALELFIPKGTSEDWSTGRRKHNDHVWLLLQAVLGLYRHPAFALRKSDPHT